MKGIINVDVVAAIESVEYLNDIAIPWNVSFWLKKVIECRKQDMISIYNREINTVDNKVLIKK